MERLCLTAVTELLLAPEMLEQKLMIIIIIRNWLKLNHPPLMIGLMMYRKYVLWTQFFNLQEKFDRTEYVKTNDG